MMTNSQSNFFRSLVRILGVVAIVGLAFVNDFDAFRARAAVRLPEEALSAEPWLLPSSGIPPVVDTTPIRELAAPAEALKRTTLGPSKPATDRPRRPNISRKEKRALAELMGLVGSSCEEPSFLKSFESFQSCREFVAINC